MNTNLTPVRRMLLCLGMLVSLIAIPVLSGCASLGKEESVAAFPEGNSPVHLPGRGGGGSASFQPPRTNAHFSHLNLQDGLSQSSVNAIWQDAQGFMWFGTEDGLNRYDGYKFRVYRPIHGDENSLSDVWITAIHQDMNDLLWIGTLQGGVNTLDPATGKITRYLHDPDTPGSISGNLIHFILEDSQQNLWIGTNAGLDFYSRQEKRFKHMFSASGVTCMLENGQGQFWLGTENLGLVFYDSNSGQLRFHRHQIENPESISGDSILQLALDHDGKLWIGFQHGLDRFDPVRQVFEHYRYSPVSQTGLSGNTIRALFVDSNRLLWIGTNNGLDRFDHARGEFIHYRHDPQVVTTISSNAILSLYEDRGGVIWIGTVGGGVSYFSYHNNQFTHYYFQADNRSGLGGNMVMSLDIDDNSIVWIGTYGQGLDRFDPRSGAFTHIRNRSRQNIFPSENIATILIDSQGTLWVETETGYELLDRSISSMLLGGQLTEPGEGSGLPLGVFTSAQKGTGQQSSLFNNRVFSTLVDSQGVLWVGTEAGLDRWNSERGRFHHFLPVPGDPASLPGAPVYDLLEASDGRIWIATQNGLAYFRPETNDFVQFRRADDDPVSLSDSALTTLLEDQDGSIWVGTFTGGLNHLDIETGRFTRYLNHVQVANSLSNNTVLSLYQDEQGILWIGTGGGGLNRFDTQAKVFRVYRIAQGLANDVVHSIIADKFGMLWMGTNNGLSRFDPDTGDFTNFSPVDGLQGTEFNMNAVAKSPSGLLYFGGTNGLSVFDPSAIRNDMYVPPVALIEITQDGQPVEKQWVNGEWQYVLRWPLNFFEFEFAALSFARSAENQYAYMLEGADQDWFFANTTRTGRYSNLAGGDYYLRLKAANGDGVWNTTGISIPVRVVPPFWQALWFQLLLGLLVIGMIGGGYWLRMQGVKASNQELERQVTERTREIEQLFERNKELAIVEERNRLARELHDSAKQKAFAALAQLGTATGVLTNNMPAAHNHMKEAETLVYEVIQELTFLIQEIHPIALKEKGLPIVLREYVFEWKNRNHIDVLLQIENEHALSLKVEQALYRTMQEALANIARHSQATHVEISLIYADDTIRVTVKDNGKGFDVSHRGLGMGLLSIRERMESVGGWMKIESAFGSGTQIQVQIPLQRSEE